MGQIRGVNSIEMSISLKWSVMEQAIDDFYTTHIGRTSQRGIEVRCKMKPRYHQEPKEDIRDDIPDHR